MAFKDLAQGREYYANHRDQFKKYHQKYRNSEKGRVYRAIETLRAKLEVLHHYSNGHICCRICGENRLDCLSIDHIDGRGGQHRKQIKRAGSPFYFWLRTNNYPKGYQVLCMNCQFVAKAEQHRRGWGL